MAKKSAQTPEDEKQIEGMIALSHFITSKKPRATRFTPVNRYEQRHICMQKPPRV
jgi:hypothetical protein